MPQSFFYIMANKQRCFEKRRSGFFPGKTEKSSNQFGTKTHSIEQ